MFASEVCLCDHRVSCRVKVPKSGSQIGKRFLESNQTLDGGVASLHPFARGYILLAAIICIERPQRADIVGIKILKRFTDQVLCLLRHHGVPFSS
jgi:hypothetical protein